MFQLYAFHCVRIYPSVAECARHSDTRMLARRECGLESKFSCMRQSEDAMTNVMTCQPVSRTYQYRKIMKPMLERKRRARINKCLDELKELIVSAIAAEGDNVSKLEKADVLELTVNHLRKLKRLGHLTSTQAVVSADKFKAGFTHCASEISKCLAHIPGIDVELGTRLMAHLGHCVTQLDRTSPLILNVQECYTPPVSPISPPDSVEVAPYGEELCCHRCCTSPFPYLPDRALLTVSKPLNLSASGDFWRPW